MIEIRNVIKNFGSRQVLKGISFRVEDGQIAGLLGSNGAGKSTTMNILAGCLSSTEGEVSIQGFDTLTQPVKSRGQIGYLPETPPLYDDMTVEEYLDFAGRLKGIKDREERKSTLTEVMAKTGVSQVAGRLIGNLSKGYRQRLGLAQALMGSPPVLILDEPMAGLDPEQTVEMRNLIQGLGGEHTIIVSSHFLSDLQAICDKMIIMVDGRIAFEFTAHMIKTHGFQQFFLAVDRVLVRIKRVVLLSTAVCGIDSEFHDVTSSELYSLYNSVKRRIFIPFLYALFISACIPSVMLSPNTHSCSQRPISTMSINIARSRSFSSFINCGKRR